MKPARPVNLVDDVTVYKGTSLESFSVVGSPERSAMHRVNADLPDQSQGQVHDK